MPQIYLKNFDFTKKDGTLIECSQIYVKIENKGKTYDYALKLPYEQVDFLKAMLDWQDDGIKK